MSGPRALEVDGVRITALGRPIHDELPGAEVAAWRSGPGEASHDEQQAEEQGREREIAAQGWKEDLFVPAVRAKLQSLFGAPPSRGDDYKLSFEYPLRAETPAGTALLAVGDWKAFGIVFFQEHTTASPEARRLARRAVWRAIADAPLADFEDRFGYDDAEGVAYGCRDGRPWIDAEALGAKFMEAWEAESAARRADAPRRGVPAGAWLVWAASVATGVGVGARWGWAFGFFAWALVWAVARPILRTVYRRG